jgi:hypothetical protein
MSDSESATEARPADKRELLARIQQEWDALEETIAGLTEAQMLIPDAGGWSAKDNLAHLATWERWLLEHHLGDRPAHEMLGIDETTLESLDEAGINEVILRRNRDRPVADVLAELRATHRRILARFDALSFADLLRPRYADDPEQAPVLDWVIGNTYDHFREHAGNIRRNLLTTRPL